MNERPRFDRVLADHQISHHGTTFATGFSPCRCSCGLDYACPVFQSWNFCEHYHRAHLAAALHSEVARWLGDEGVRDRVGQALVDYENAKDSLEDTSIYGYVTAALAALTVPTAEEAHDA